MLGSDRQEFETQLSMLCSGFNVPIGERAAAYWLGLSKMELVTFARVVVEALGENGPDKMPTVGACWNISKKIRAAKYPPRAAEIAGAQWNGDHWDIKANLHLFLRVRGNPKRYAPDSTYDPMLRQAIPGPLTRAYTEIVVRWKHTWAEDMRVESNPTAAVMRAAWEDCMERADAEIAQMQQARAA